MRKVTANLESHRESDNCLFREEKRTGVAVFLFKYLKQKQGQKGKITKTEAQIKPLSFPPVEGAAYKAAKFLSCRVRVETQEQTEA